MFEAVAPVSKDMESDLLSPVTAKRRWRAFEAETAHIANETNIRVGIAASFTANSLTPFIGSALLEAGFAPDVIIGEYDQIFQTCLDPETFFAKLPDVIVLLFRLEDLFAAEIDTFLVGNPDAMRLCEEKIDSLCGAIAQLRAGFAGTIIVSAPPFPTDIPADSFELNNASNIGALHRHTVTALVTAFEKIKDVRTVDLDAVQRHVGISKSYDCRQRYLYRQPFTDAFLLEAGNLIARIMVASRRASKKCVVVDCDNTLWGGIVGEDELHGIQIGDDFPGLAFQDFQRLLLYWREQGIFIALASKNNEADVWEVFDKHDGMLLKRDHISAWQINWESKAENIHKIASELNIGVDSLVFIDDNPMEIAYMRSACPSVASFLVPADPAEILSVMQNIKLFDRQEITDEDRERANMMHSERKRAGLAGKMTKEEFLDALELRIEVLHGDEESFGRISQLINKTNQFNLTTVRRTLEALRQLAASENWRIYGFKVSDKFGDYGLTGVAILNMDSANTWRIDTFLMSCRVLGRNVENSMLAIIADDLGRDKGQTMVGAFIPTAKNSMVANFLRDHGFQPLADGTWGIAMNDMETIPKPVTRVAKGTL
jgi:FkbH-like protein